MRVNSPAGALASGPEDVGTGAAGSGGSEKTGRSVVLKRSENSRFNSALEGNTGVAGTELRGVALDGAGGGTGDASDDAGVAARDGTFHAPAELNREFSDLFKTT